MFSLPDGKPIKSVEVQDGDRIHPGGIAGDGPTLWVPVAPYARTGQSLIEQRNKETLELISSFTVEDHIGCVAAGADRLYGGNWDSRQIYVWDMRGKLLKRLDNPTPNRYQDMKVAGGRLVASGKIGERGAVDWLEPDSLKLLRRVTGGETDRKVSYMSEGMTLREDKLYFLPEDGASRLFAFTTSK